MEEYLRVKAGRGRPGARARAALFQAFAMATPGMRELLSIGKVWELAQLERRTRGAAPYDLVIVDAPATGHGVGAAAHAAHVRRDRPRRADRPPGPDDRRHDRRPRVHRRGRRRARPRRCRSTRRSTLRDAARERRAGARRGRRQRAATRTGSTPREVDELDGALADDAARRWRARRCARRCPSTRARATQREQRDRLRRRARRPPASSSRTCSAESIEPRASSSCSPARWRRQLMNVAELLEGKRVCVCAGAGRRRQDHHLGRDRARDGRARAPRSPW